MYHVRTICPKDTEAWLSLRMAVYEDDDREGNLAEMKVYAADDLRDCFVAVDEADNVVGLLEMSLRSIVDGCLTSPVGYIEGIIVREGMRGRGIGRLLTERARAWSLEKGCKEMGTDALLTNIGAQQFHESVGFKEVDRVVGYKMSLVGP